MKVTNEIVDKIAKLSKLEFDNESRDEIKKDLNNMLELVEKLNELNTENVEPLIYITDEVNRYRKDEVKMEIDQKQALKNGPQHDSDYFKVPKVVENTGK